MVGRRARVAAAMVALVLPLLTLGGSGAEAARPTGAYDRGISRGDCLLLGRKYAGEQGCARRRCVAGAVLFNANVGAEECASRQGKHPYGAIIDSRLCAALGRVWIAAANYCASNPDRDFDTQPGAPQCADRTQIYVNLDETEGHYDECLPAAYVNDLVGFAASTGSTLTAEVDRRSAVQCPNRPSRVFVDGLCQPSNQPPPASTNKVLLIGDSVAWRASDELGAKRPAFAIDAVPARKVAELAGRLAAYRAIRGNPTGLILELGTNASDGFGRGDLEQVVDSLPASTRLMFVLPYRYTGGAPAMAVTYGRWMRDIARHRGSTCVLDWPATVRKRPGLMLDEVHPTKRGEQVYAGLVASAWTRCD